MKKKQTFYTVNGIFIAVLCILTILVTSVPVYADQYRELTNIDNFDETHYPGYKQKLQALKAEHPNWNFIIFYTGLNWNTVLDNETTEHHGRSLVQGKTGEWVCSECGTTPKEGTNWYCASRKAVGYYLDPRNFLTTEDIFQFENLSYVEGLYTLEGIESILSGTFMNNKSIKEYYNNENYTSKKFSEIMMEVGKELGVSPYHLASRVRQEVIISGGGPSGSASGKFSGLEGYYNFFNIKASGTNAVQKGLEYAKEQGWNTPEKAIRAGAEVISKNYISKNQNTLYLEKFDVDSSYNSLYYHQYQQNIQAPSSEGKRVYTKVYSSILNNNFNFVIPVYENMPVEVSSMPSSDTVAPTTELTGEIVKVNTESSPLILREQPSKSSNRLASLPKGTLLARLEKNVAASDGITWDKVKTASGLTGYVSSEYIIVVQAAPNTTSNENNQNNNENAQNNVEEKKIVIDEDGKSIGCEPKATVQTLKDSYGGKNVVVKNSDGTEITDVNINLATGMNVIVDNVTYKVVKYGDVSGNGEIAAGDALRVLKYAVGQFNLEGEYFKAADITKDGIVNASDALRILKYTVGQFRISL